MTKYDCHHTSVPRRVVKCSPLRKGSNHSFHLNVRVNEGGKHGIVSIYVYRCHLGHVPRKRLDVYHLPIHPNVIECCKYDIFYVGCARHVAQMSMQKEVYHKSKATPLEIVSFKFFMIPKEVHNMANTLKIGSAMLEVDWSLMMQDAYAL